MNNRVNYTLVGFLVLFGISLMLGFSYWLLKPSAEEETKKYLIYFDESVLGLNLDAPVKYRGINVGKVSRLKINPKNSQQVEVLVTILKTTPIKSTTIAKLTSQGITGLSYINLSLGGDNAPILKAKEGEQYPVIRTEPSFFERFDKSFDTVSTKLSKALSKTEKLLNDKNQEQVALILKRTANFMYEMELLIGDKNQEQVSLLLQKSINFMDKAENFLDEKTISHFHSSIKNLESTSRQFDMIMPRIDNLIDKSVMFEDNISISFASIKNSYTGIKSSMDEIKRAVSSGEFNFKKISNDMLPVMNNTMLEMQQLIVEMRSAINHYNRSPNDILFKSEEMKKGPGER